MDILARADPSGLLIFDRDSAMLVELKRDEARLLGYRGPFPDDEPAPRFVHIELTSRCNMQCQSCYVKRDDDEMTTPKIKEVLRELVSMRTFQVAFGGGEPFLRSDLFELAQYATSLGIVVTTTTNGTLVEDVSQLSLFKQINVSYHGDIKVLERALDIVQRHTAAGVNFVMSKTDANMLNVVASLCKKRGAELLLLAYKPVNGNWNEQISPEIVMGVARKLSHDGLRIAVDGFACSVCVAAHHFVDVAASGDVYPCSFIRRPMGNVMLESFERIWARRISFKPSECPYRRKQK